MQEIRDAVCVIANQHTAKCLFTKGIHTSHHQAYAVLLEEVEEMEEALRTARGLLAKAWAEVRDDNVSLATLDSLHKALYNGVSEGVQCISMAEKWKLFVEQEQQ